jgi:dephospho-CoA kinase
MSLILKVIGFCGLPGSGKSTALESVKNLGIIVNMGDVIRNEAIKKSIELTDENLGQLARSMRLELGEDIIAKKCVEMIRDFQHGVVFVDGIRSIYELKIFRKFWAFPLISIETEEKFRHQRILNRARDDDSSSIIDIKKREEREISFGLLELIQKADYVIKNNSTINDLKKNTKKLINQLIRNYKTS